MLMHVSLRRNVDHYVQSEGVKSGSLVHLKLEWLPLYCICIIDEHFAHCCSFCQSGITNSWDLISHPCMEKLWCHEQCNKWVMHTPRCSLCIYLACKSWIFMIMHVGSVSPLCHTVGGQCEPRVNKCIRDAVTKRLSDCSEKKNVPALRLNWNEGLRDFVHGQIPPNETPLIFGRRPCNYFDVSSPQG